MTSGAAFDMRFREVMKPRLTNHGSWALLGLLLASSYGISITLGGSEKFEPLWVLIPISYAAWRLGSRATAAAVVASMVLMGPFMPAVVSTGTPQELIDWTSRGFFFAFLGALLAYLFGHFRRTVALVEAQRDAAVSAGLMAQDAQELRQAIQAGQLYMHYQPIVRAADSELVAVEALVRWEHPVRGQISPADFIPFAESAGVIQELDAWVVRTSAHEVAGWQATRPIRLGVNLSTKTVSDPAAVIAVERAIEDSGLDPRLIDLEMTETAMIDDDAATLAGLDRLAGLGARLSLDDFGMGYAVLDRLRSLPFSTIKVDRSFVNGVTGKEAPMVEAIVRMAHAMGLDVLAEGVESADQFETLQELGVDMIQGFLISRPVSAADLRLLLSVGTQRAGTRPARRVLIEMLATA
jgi:EAL domain-containing protein (putative c-di-GMP-specific phosphodiesterase class I)